ncbi:MULTISPECIES: helix-turn-helix domain-containing protein [Streptomyces]|uniref:HTH cro/C1-type domain-containing protein n=1 Tax=Streptomyces luteosporeus TaxID=173856 RepID=A0ABN3TK05_9ACTN
MTRWTELPGSLDESVSRLVVQLRRLKDHSGLSLSSLAAKTSYSRSSWERYLNGRALPPREAVEQLARLCGADVPRLLVLHEVAEQSWAQERQEKEKKEPDAQDAQDAQGAPPVDAGPGPAPAGHRAGRWTAVLVGAVVVLAVALVSVLLLTRPWEEDDGPPSSGGDTPAPFVFVQGRSRPCDVEKKGGELRAGYSSTHTTLMDLKSSGWEVLEAQCLLRYHGYDPGITDGSYGERSKAAAQRFQKDRGLVVDGIVGPDTWEELRR